MYLDDLQEVLDSINLVDDYHNLSSIKDLVKTNFVYKNNRPVTVYVSNLVRFSPFFAGQWRVIVTQGKELGQRRNWSPEFRDTFQKRLDTFLEVCFADQSGLKEVERKAFAAYTGRQPSPAELQNFRQIQTLPSLQRQNALTALLGGSQQNKNQPTPQAQQQINLSPEEEEAVKIRGIEEDVTATPVLQAAEQTHPISQAPSSRFEDIGQGLPETPHPPADMEVIHEPEELATARKATVPVNIVNRTRAVLTNPTIKIVQRPIANAAKTAISTGQIKAVSRADSAVNAFFGQVGRQSPVLTFLGARSGGGSITRRGLSLMTPKIPLGGKAAKVNVIFAIILGLLAFLLFGFNENATLCPPWQGCAKGLGPGPGSNVPATTLIVTKEGPPSGEVPNDTAITYTITIVYKGVGTAKVDLIDKIPTDTKFSSATQTDNFERKNENTPNETLVWHLEGLNLNEAKQVKFTVIPQKHDFWAVNNATSNVTSITGVSGQGLLCVPEVDPRLVPFFEQSAVAANLSPAIMYAIGRGEHIGTPKINAQSLDNIGPVISACGAHGIMQITHINDGSGKNYGASCQAAGGTSKPIEAWDGLVSTYNTQTGGKLINVDHDEDNIWGSSFFVRNEKINVPNYFRDLPDYNAFKAKGPNDQYTQQEVIDIARAYHGGTDASYDNLILNSYKEAIASQGTCGTPVVPAPVPGTGTGKLIVLDPGHDTNNTFKESKTEENALNRATAAVTATLLVKNGYRVIITTPDGVADPNIEGKYYEDLQRRIDLATNNNAAAFIAIHGDNTNDGAQGRALIDNQVGSFHKQDAESTRLGQLTNSKISSALGFSSRGTSYDTYYQLTPAGTATACRPRPEQQFGVVYFDNGNPTSTLCDVYNKPAGSEVSAPAIIQEIYIGGHPYSTLNSKVPIIAKAYCDAIAQFLDNKDCTP